VQDFSCTQGMFSSKIDFVRLAQSERFDPALSVGPSPGYWGTAMSAGGGKT
jgi:hypothetical protein